MNSDKRKKQKKEYREKNKDKCKLAIKKWHEKNKEKFKEYQSQWRKENVGHIKEKSHSDYIKNKDRIIERHKKNELNNKEKYAALRAEWAKRNRDKVRVTRNNRKKSIGKFGTSDIKRLKTSQNDKCAACLCCIKESYHIDHIIPLSKGGSNWPDNIQLLCPLCNRRKAAKMPEVWAAEIRNDLES